MIAYYQDELVTLYLGDSTTTTEWAAADVLVTDPPYGMGYTGFGGRKGEPRRSAGRLTVAGDETTAARDTVLAAWGTKPGIVFGRWDYTRPANTLMRLIWDKTPCGFMGDLKMPWGAAEEEVYILGKGFVGKRQENILRYPTMNSMDASRPDHPTPKPLSLMMHLIQRCPPGVIADPFAGSGSTLLAARTLGRASIGVEIDERYCELIATRLQQQAFDFGDWNAAS